MNLELTQHCHQQLTPHQFAVFSVARHCIGQVVQSSELSEFLGGMGADTVRIHLSALQKRGFLMYRSLPGQGFYLLWARESVDEKSPSTVWARQQVSYRIENDNGEKHVITHGNIRAFSDRHGLNYRAFRDVLSGGRNHHHGWRLAR